MDHNFNKFQYFTIVLAFICSSVLSQEIGSPWIDVRGKSNKEVEKLLRNEVRNIDSYSIEIIEETQIQLQEENDSRTIDFNNRKVTLRTALNTAIDEKNYLSIEVNDLKDQLALKQSEVSALEQKIADSDSSSAMSKQLIIGEKARIKDELTKIPYYEVLIARVKDFPENASNVSDYDNKMSHEISKMAIESQLGIDIIKKTIVKDGTLTENAVLTSLSGKANSNLTLALLDVINKNTGKLTFDRYRYGLVTVYPFQEEEVSLGKTPSMSGIDVNVEIVTTTDKGIAGDLPKVEKRKLNNLLNEKKLKNGDSESQIKRLARNSKRLISLENGKIKRNNQAVRDYNERKKGIIPLIADYKDQLNFSTSELSASVQNFSVSKSSYESHLFSESYVEVFPWEGYTSADESIAEKYAEFAVESFQEFLTSKKSEYLKEESKVTQDLHSEIKESKKTDVVLNKIKLLGKFAKSKGRRMQLSIYIAYNYGFQFEQIGDSSHIASIAPVSKTTKGSAASTKPSSNMSFNLNITSSPTGADVKSGRKKLGITPLKTYLEPGLHSLVIKKKGYKPAMEVLEVNSSGVLLTGSESHFVLQADDEKKAFNKLYIYGGLAAVGGGAALYLLSQGENETTKETGSVSVTIQIP